MAITVGSSSLTDAEFLRALERCELPMTQFRHGDHLRLAWIELHAKPFPAALGAVRAKIRRFGAYHGQANLYHETITTAWVSLLATHDEATFDEFLRVNHESLKVGLLDRYWSRDLLKSDAARTAWVAPDLEPLPEVLPQFKKREGE